MANVNSVEHHNDIAYVPTISRDKDRELDLYVPPTEKGSGKPPLIVFVHGGAWGGGDKSQHVLLAQKLATSTGYAVAVVNYRLSTPHKPLPHPTHASDVLTALSFLLSWVGPIPSGGTHASRPYDNTRLYLMAHSCGPHILASILLDSSTFYPTLAPPPPGPGNPTLLDVVQAVVCTEGIFDLDLLISSFPNYKDWFIARSFGPGPLYPEADVTGYSLRKQGGKDRGAHIRWLLINSAGDTLVDAKQSEAMHKHLVSLLPPVTEGATPSVVLDIETFTQEHDDVLDTDKIVEVTTQFIKQDSVAE